jgi:2-C-methyl-D-erythritol 4-phosphate cytidylyltransferase/2-C-methyl-D-erythritol 2,4-cyclodiphosphate synthase
MKAVAVLLAAGSGTRFGSDKTLLQVKGKPLWQWSYDVFRQHPQIDSVGIVCSAENYNAFSLDSNEVEFLVVGGATRQESSRIALENVPIDTDVVLIHDAARPFVSEALISRVLEGIEHSQAAAPGLAITDTVKQVDSTQFLTLDRSRLFTVQTPQGATRDLLVKAHKAARQNYTDEMALIEAVGVRPEIVEGDPRNIKVTTPSDIDSIQAVLGPPETRSGIGYDIHRFSTDMSRPLMLGGIKFEGHPGLDGHSDADVLIHAVVDALLGAAGLGDIGQHFPDTDQRWKNEPSASFLKHARQLLAQHSWKVSNVDVTLIAEFPKVMKQSESIKASLADSLGIETSRINIKATTNETLGAIGRGEGIAAFAIASIVESKIGVNR